MDELIAKKSFKYGTRHLVAGDLFLAKPKDSRLLVAVKRAAHSDEGLNVDQPVEDQVVVKPAKAGGKRKDKASSDASKNEKAIEPREIKAGEVLESAQLPSESAATVRELTEAEKASLGSIEQEAGANGDSLESGAPLGGGPAAPATYES